ncbi:hypothetical protein A7D35_16560 [Xanthomonas arboricola]|nr:hypothetical protein A7D35_16560 [Xanthomonas arboricola]PPU31142.1 hypothetical protein XarbCFBP7604_17015 [Xanthomonas arboricola]
MQLIGFSIAEDFIALERGLDRFDLHNNFDFQGMSYAPAQQTLELHWHRGTGDWVKPSDPPELSLSFAGVYLFKTQERDPTVPFTEDNCLDSLGFMWDDLLAEMRAFASSRPSEGCNHLTANFMSGFSIKVGAVSATLHVSGGA